MYLRPMKIDNNQPIMREHATGPMTSFTWSKNGIGYSVVGAAAPDILHPLANQVRAQIETGI
jgi:anti-sigma factor RsiW